MDRDPRANVVDPVERVTPSTGENDTGEVGDEAARIERERRDERHEPDRSGARDRRVGSDQDGEDPNLASDRLAERDHPGLHGGSGDPAWKSGA
jgi:hypothetical protein